MDGGSGAAGDSAPPTSGTARGGDFGSVLAIVGVIASQAVLITAVLYYFGWVRTNGFLSYFGVDPNMAGFSTADYVLRSISVAFAPLISAAFIALVLCGMHRLLVAPTLEGTESGFIPSSTPTAQALAGPVTSGRARPALVRALRRTQALARWRPGLFGVRRLLVAINIVGVALAVVVLTGLLLPAQIGAPLGISLPLILIIGVTLLGYVTHLRSKYRASFTQARSRYVASRPSRAYNLILFTLGLVGALWAVGIHGENVGRNFAVNMVDHLYDEPSVTIYSIDPLAIAGHGVRVNEISQFDAKYHYQYSRLRLLLHSPEKYLLLPEDWRRGHGRVFLVRDDDTIRVDITTR